MLATIGGPDALSYSMEANRLARDLLDQDRENDDMVELFYLSQDILRAAQAQASAAREEGPAVGQQTTNIGPANVISYIEKKGIVKAFRPTLGSIKEEQE